MSTYQVMIGVHDDELENALTARFEEIADAEVVGAFRSSHEISDALSQFPALDVVLIHEDLGPLPVLELIRDISRNRPQLAVILIVDEISPALFTSAVEAGAHAYAARHGHYGSLSMWEATPEGDLAGSLELPLAVGLVGGATRVHPTAQLALKILGVGTAEELARVIAAVGLAQNFSALKALATTGIQKGHMALHARNIAIMAGATGEEVEAVARALVAQGRVRMDVAEAELQALRRGRG